MYHNSLNVKKAVITESRQLDDPLQLRQVCTGDSWKNILNALCEEKQNKIISTHVHSFMLISRHDLV